MPACTIKYQKQLTASRKNENSCSNRGRETIYSDQDSVGIIFRYLPYVAMDTYHRSGWSSNQKKRLDQTKLLKLLITTTVFNLELTPYLEPVASRCYCKKLKKELQKQAWTTWKRQMTTIGFCHLFFIPP